MTKLMMNFDSGKLFFFKKTYMMFTCFVYVFKKLKPNLPYAEHILLFCMCIHRVCNTNDTF